MTLEHDEISRRDLVHNVFISSSDLIHKIGVVGGHRLGGRAQGEGLASGRV